MNSKPDISDLDALLEEGAVQIVNNTPGGAASTISTSAPPSSSSSPTPPPLLFNFTAPFHLNKRERPAHRIMVELAAKGYNNKEIAEQLGRTAVNVNNALRQPHAQPMIVDDIRRKVSEDTEVVEFIKSSVREAVGVLKEVMTNSDARNSDRIAAAEALLNRRYGKPNQPINSGNTVDLNNLPDSELARMLPTALDTATETSKSV